MNRRTLLRAAALSPHRGDRTSPSARPGWPDRPMRIVVPFVPGSFTDVSARLVANELTEQLGQPVVVENRGGAGGTAGTTVVVRAAPDGYTLLLTDTSLSISPGLYPNLPYDPVRDLAQISRIADSPSILLVRPGLGPRTLAELVALGEAEAGRAHLRLRRAGLVGASRDGAAAQRRGRPGAARAVPRRRGGDRRSRSPAASTWRSRASPRVWRRCRAARCSASACPARSAARLLPQVPTFAEAGQPRYDMSVLVGYRGAGRHAARRSSSGCNREIVQACAKPRLREAFLQAGRRRRHLDAGGDDAASRARDRRLARRDRARQGHRPVARRAIEGRAVEPPERTAARLPRAAEFMRCAFPRLRSGGALSVRRR